MDPTIRSADQLEPQQFPWGEITWLANGKMRNSEHQTVGKVIIRARQSNPVHRHDNCEEILYLLEGELDHLVGDGEVWRMSAGDTLTVPAGVAHNATAVGKQDAVMIVCYSSPRREMSQ